MSVWTAPELRAAVLEVLGPHADEDARAAIEHGTVAVAPAVAQWESSGGPTEGHSVVLAVDARRMGALRARHASLDAIVSAFAAVVATRPGQAMADLSLAWSRQGDVHEGGYRDAVTHESSLPEALAAYLDALGESGLAGLAGAMITRRGAEVRLVVAPAVRAHLRARPEGDQAVVRAVRDLLGDPALRVVVDA